MKTRPKLTKLFLLYLIVLVNLLFIASCTSNQKPNNSEEKNPWSNFDVKSLSHIEPLDIIDTSSIKLIRLETKKESAFANIDKLLVTDEFLLVCDYDKTKAVLMFDCDGNFVRKISGLGRGPGEYTRLYAVDIDRKNHQIIIYDLSTKKLIFYGYDGTFLKEIHLKNYCGMTFSCVNDTLFAFYLHINMDGNHNELEWGNGCEVLFVNKDGEIVNTAFQLKFNNPNAIIMNTGYFAKNDSRTYFIPSYHGTIYQIKEDGNIIENFDFQLDDLLFTSKEMRDVKSYEDIETYKKFRSFSDFIINSKGHFFCESRFNGIQVKFFGDTNSKNLIAFDNFYERGKIIHYTLPLQIAESIVATHEDYFVSSIHTHLLRSTYFPDADRADNKSLAFFKLKDDLNLDELLN